MTQFEACHGGCTCGYIRYSMRSAPLIVHGCHCSWCQRQTGTAFATNALIEADRVEVTGGHVENTILDTPGGSGQRIARCPKCRVAVWSEYLSMTAGLTDLIYFVRVGTLDSPARLPPDVHIYTSTMQPWLKLPPDVPAVPGYYEMQEIWSESSLERFSAIRKKIKERKS